MLCIRYASRSIFFISIRCEWNLAYLLCVSGFDIRIDAFVCCRDKKLYRFCGEMDEFHLEWEMGANGKLFSLANEFRNDGSFPQMRRYFFLFFCLHLLLYLFRCYAIWKNFVLYSDWFRMCVCLFWILDFTRFS